MSDVSIRFSTEILQRLGEELTSGLDEAILELVKNAYDADATQCVVELSGTEIAGGSIMVSDDGVGMTEDDISRGWLVVGSSRKNPASITPAGRLPAGSKGLGRLGALRAGASVELRSRPAADASVEYRLRINWDDYTRAAVVEDVVLNIETQRRSEPSQNGTTVTISGLRFAFSEEKVRNLAREVLLLTDPFAHREGFKVTLHAPGFEDLERLVAEGYFEHCEFHLSAVMDASGVAKVEVQDRSGTIIWGASGTEIGGPYRAPEATLEMWVFLLQPRSFADSSVTRDDVALWLKEVGGVHLYHRGLRVRPYGDPGHDWLEMNLARARDPELRPSTNTAIGRVIVTDAASALVAKTDRSGFVENEQFRELQRFGRDVLDWLHKRRIERREKERREAKKNARSQMAAAQEKTAAVIEGLPPSEKPAVARVVKQLERAASSERAVLQRELRLYRTMASIGGATAVTAHEVVSTASQIRSVATETLDLVREHKGAPALSEAVVSLSRLADRLSTLARLPLTLLRAPRRKARWLDLPAAVQSVLHDMKPYLDYAKVTATLEFAEGRVQVHAAQSDIDAIVMNILTNAVRAFEHSARNNGVRSITIRISSTANTAVLAILDTGPGIRHEPTEDIWLPGVTDYANGTGLGLTIVRDTVTDLGGRVTAVASGEMGGAEFLMELPCRTR